MAVFLCLFMPYGVIATNYPLENYKRAPPFRADVRYFQGVIATHFFTFQGKDFVLSRKFTNFATHIEVSL